MSVETPLKPRPYVGVSGVVSPEQQVWIRDAAVPITEKGRRLLIGVKAVDKNHWLEIRNKYGPYHYPVGDAISHSVSKLSKNEIAVAQVYLDHEAAADRGDKDYEVRFIDKLLGRCAWTGIQFDMLPWHEIDYTALFERIKQQAPLILLQCHGDIMKTHTPEQVVELLKPYNGLVDYVLFDASHGKGITLDTNALEPFVDAASGLSDIGLGVAGGLNAQVIQSPEFIHLLQDYPELSFDAEGGLRPNKMGALDQETTENYLSAAGRVIVPVG